MQRTLTVLKALASMFYEDFYGMTFIFGAFLVPIIWIVNLFVYLNNPLNGMHHFTFLISILYLIPLNVAVNPTWRNFKLRTSIFILLSIHFLLVSNSLNVKIISATDIPNLLEYVGTTVYQNGMYYKVFESYYLQYPSMGMALLVASCIIYIFLGLISIGDPKPQTVTSDVMGEEASKTVIGAFTQGMNHLRELLGEDSATEVTDQPNPDDDPDYIPPLPED